jgi:hypothetical protein
MLDHQDDVTRGLDLVEFAQQGALIVCMHVTMHLKLGIYLLVAG